MRPTVLHTTRGSWRWLCAGLLTALVMGCGTSPQTNTPPADNPAPGVPADDAFAPDPSYNPYDELGKGLWPNDPPARDLVPEDVDREGAARRKQTTSPLLAQRPWNAAILTCSPEEVEVANYLKAKSAVTYPNVTITIVPVAVTPNTGTGSSSISISEFVSKVGSALTAAQATAGRFQMIQLLHQFPHHVSWPPHAQLCIPTESLWSPESILMCGADSNTLADSPPSFNPWPSAPFSPYQSNYLPWYGNANWRMDYIVTRLEGRTKAQVMAKIDLAHAPKSSARPGVVIDGPGKAGPANNYNGGTCNLDTYWEHMWETDGLFNVASKGTKYGFPVKNDMAGYSGDTNNNCDDDASEMPSAAYQYQTSSTFPVGYLVCFERHSNGDGRFGPAWTGPGIYTNLQFAPRSVVAAMESFTGYSLERVGNKGGLGAWLDLPVAGVIAFKNEPCLTGIYHDVFSEAYVGRNATFGEAAMASFQFLKTIDTAFGVAWMTLQ